MSNEFARRFTGIAATVVIILIVINVSWQAYRNDQETKIKREYVAVLQTHLRGNNITYDEITVRNSVMGGSSSSNLPYTTGRRITVYYNIKNLAHATLGSAPNSNISAVLVDQADGNYILQDFSITDPEEMSVNGWYY